MNASATARRTTPEWLSEIGQALRQRRIRADLTQDELARRSGVGLSALKHLEAGTGANLTSLVKVVRALGLEDWLGALTPQPEPAVSPMQLLRARQRVRRSCPPTGQPIRAGPTRRAAVVPYRQADLIEVRCWGSTAGAVAQDPASGFYAFEYDSAWLSRGIELAPLHMPARPGVYVFPELAERTYARLPAMLADSLPDRFGNALVTAKLAEEGVPADRITSLDRLAYTADRGMGALEYRPPAGGAAEHSTALQLADLVVAARQALRGEFTGDDTAHEALTQLIQVGTSAGGARPKAVVCFNPETGQVRSGQLEAPQGFEHWLLKLDGVEDDRFGPGLGFGRIEYAYSRMAAAAGIVMEPCRLLIENDRAHFMTRRFDRRPDGTKVHVQTLCALDHLDFNQPDTHSYAQYLDVIDRLALGPDDREQAFRRIAFNIAGVNRDDHTKNLSFCCDESGRWSLAPAYDVNHAYNPRGRWTQRHQMSVNQKFEGITRADLLELADRYVVPAPVAVLDEVQSAVDSWPEFAAEGGVGDADMERIRADHAAFRL